MNKKTFNTLDDLEEFINSFPDNPKYIFDVQQQDADSEFLVQWQEQKYYTAQNGVVYPEEIWIDKDGAPLQIQDISEEKLRNIVRMIVRHDREHWENIEKAFLNLENAIGSYLDFSDDLDDNFIASSVTLH